MATGSYTPNKYFYKPGIGETTTQGKTNFDNALNCADTTLASLVSDQHETPTALDPIYVTTASVIGLVYNTATFTLGEGGSSLFINTSGVVTDYLNACAVTSAKLGNCAVTTDKLGNSAVTSAKIADSAVTSTQIDACSVTTTKLGNCAVTTSQIGDCAVTTAKIDSYSVTTVKLGNSSVTTNQLGTSAVTTAKLDACAVTTAKIGDSAVTSTQLGASSVITTKIGNCAVTTNQLGGSAVTSAKIADSAITSTQIDASAVISTKIGNCAVTTAKIGDSAVTSTQLGACSVTTAKIQDSAITSTQLGACAVTSTKIGFNLDDIPDVDTTGVIDGYSLVYSAATTATGSWQVKEITGGVVGECAITSDLIDWGVSANEVSSANIPIGSPADSDWTDGVLVWSGTTTIADALDEINETLSSLAPSDAISFNGISLTCSGTFYSGRLAAGGASYGANASGYTAGATISTIIKSGTITFTLPAGTDYWNKGDEGVLNLYLNTTVADTIDLSATFTEGERTGSQSGYPLCGAGTMLVVTAVTCYNSFAKWQRGYMYFRLMSTQLTGGYNAIYLNHDLSTDQNSTTFQLFYDNSTAGNPSVGTVSVTEKTPVFKWLSGVKFYDRASTFSIACSASNCFANVYHSTSPLYYSSTGTCLGSATIDYNAVGASAAHDPPEYGDTFIVTSVIVTTPNSQVRSTNAKIQVVPRDPYTTYTINSSADSNRLVEAYTATATTLIEYFDDEVYRLPNADSAAAEYPDNYDVIPTAISSAWQSTSHLTDGDAQVYQGALYVPTLDFTSGYLPTGQTSNYSTHTASAIYYRAFYDLNDPHQSGTLIITNITSANISYVSAGNCNVEIKLPTQTGWLDLGKAYDSGTFAGADGDGCRTGQTGTSWSWTAGAFTTANSGWMAIIKITIRTSAQTCTQLEMSGW